MSNRAAWLTGKQVYPLEVKDAPYTRPKDDEVLIKVRYAACNPADWKMVKWGYRITKFPAIIGQDVAGDVVETGKDVSHVKAGDRVVAHVLGVTSQDFSESAFQLFTIAKEAAVAILPGAISYEQASVLPLALSTSTVGLYTSTQLALPRPSLSKPEQTGKTVLIWGGSASVGSIAIQLAKASGYKVAVTVSPRNNDYVKKLGADFTFDYSSKTVVQDILDGLKDEDLVGAFNVIGGEESGNALVEILSKNKSPSNKKHIATVPPLPSKQQDDVKVVMLGSAADIFYDEKRKDLARFIWHDFLPKALETGILKPVPEPLVAGEGVESVQKALDTLEAGVSAKKVVIKMQ